jgi:hypothetical protein
MRRSERRRRFVVLGWTVWILCLLMRLPLELLQCGTSAQNPHERPFGTPLEIALGEILRLELRPHRSR